MSQDRKFSYLGTSEQQIIPVPPDLSERGFREIGRIWRKPADKEHGERIHALIRGTYEHPGEWSAALAVMARTLAATYFPEGDELDRDRMACALLGGALSRIASERPDLNADIIEADIGDLMGVDDAGVSVLPPVPTEGPGGVSEAQPANAAAPIPVLDMDERCLPVPEEVLVDPKAHHLLTIWEQPDVPGCEDCPECGIDHMGRTYIGINTEHITNKAMGRTLGTIAKLHVQFRTQDQAKRHIGYGEVMQHFHGFMVEGMTKQ